MNYHLIQSSHPWLILPASAGHEVRNVLLQEHTGACYSPPHSSSKRPYSQKSVLPPSIALACPKRQPRYPPAQKNHALFEQHHFPLPSQCSLLALALWQHSPGSCVMPAFCPGQCLRGGNPKELVLSKGYDKILLSILPGLLPPTAQPWLRKSSKTSEKCLHATYTLLPCISGGDPGCPVNSPCKQTLTERTSWGWGQPQWGWRFLPLPKIQSVSLRIALSIC